MGLATTIRQWRASWAQERELDSLGPQLREAFARDIGISETVLSSLVARGSQAGAELPRLMEALSLDADGMGRTQPALMRDMSITCSDCAAVARCRRELGRGCAQSVYDEYCPNAETLQALQAEEAGRNAIP